MYISTQIEGLTTYHVGIGQNLPHGILEELRDEGGGEVEGEVLSVLAGVLGYLDHGRRAHRQEEAGGVVDLALFNLSKHDTQDVRNHRLGRKLVSVKPPNVTKALLQSLKVIL